MVKELITSLHNPSYGASKKRPKAKKKHAKHRSRTNPIPFALTLGAIGANPTKGVRTVAKKKKASRPSAKNKAHRKHHHKKHHSKNPGVSLATVKAMFAKKKGGKRKSRGNPYSVAGAKHAIAFSAGILGGVTLAKLLPPLLPAEWTATDVGRFFSTLGVSVAVSAAGHMILPEPYRNGLVGGLGAQTLSIALNPILRKMSSTITLGRIAQRRGMADFVNANFPEPHNPIYNRMLAAGMNYMPGATGSVGSVEKYRGRWN